MCGATWKTLPIRRHGKYFLLIFSDSLIHWIVSHNSSNFHINFRIVKDFVLRFDIFFVYYNNRPFKIFVSYSISN